MGRCGQAVGGANTPYYVKRQNLLRCRADACVCCAAAWAVVIGNLGRWCRHEVENLLKSKVMQLDETTNSLSTAEERVRGLESKNRILAGKLAKERKGREEAEQSFTALKIEAEQKMADAFDESERTTAMYQCVA